MQSQVVGDATGGGGLRGCLWNLQTLSRHLLLAIYLQLMPMVKLNFYWAEAKLDDEESEEDFSDSVTCISLIL